MKKVITYGTFDMLHDGHRNLLRRAKELGDYLIVGVTADSFDRERGKLNVKNNILERIDAVKATGYADKIIIEDYVGQKIDDIQKYGIDVFAIGSDWTANFDYLKEYCTVVYLPRTEGISSTMLRERDAETVRIGIIGCGRVASRFPKEASFVNGVEISGVFDIDPAISRNFVFRHHLQEAFGSVDALISASDAVYISTPHLSHYKLIKMALENGRHVLCETPMVLNSLEAEELYKMASEKKLVLLEANKTAFCPAFNHLMVMVKSGVIGEVVDIEASLSKLWDDDMTLREFDPKQAGGSMFELGSYPLLPIVRLMGIENNSIEFYARFKDKIDMYTKGIVSYPHAVCSFKVGLGVKTEGDMVISGTKGYAYVPAPWWKTDYFELRYEDRNRNRKFFYAWDGDGLRYEIRDFVACIVNGRLVSHYMRPQESIWMARMMELFGEQHNMHCI